MKELQPNILNDYEHVVNSLVERYGDTAGFPQLETYHVTKELVEDYLFDYQAILDSEGSQRSQQTMYGIIALLPVILLSAFPIEMLPWRSETTRECMSQRLRIMVRQRKLASKQATCSMALTAKK